jgi:hypothetical protein
VSSTQEAASHLAFSPREPQGLGNPDFIWVSAGPESARGSKVARFKYDEVPFGIVQVAMWIDPGTEEAWKKSNQAAVAKNGDICTRGTAEIVVIRGGTEAIMGFPEDDYAVSISWREGPVVIQVIGPTLKREDAISIAEKL